jgi:polyhydroxyalkanoate synthesis repressor PhaR
MRTIRRHSNRKLYDSMESNYVTLQRLSALVRKGQDFVVVDRDSGADLTAATLAQIIFEEEKRGARLPVDGLRKLIIEGMPKVYR